MSSIFTKVLFGAYKHFVIWLIGPTNSDRPVRTYTQICHKWHPLHCYSIGNRGIITGLFVPSQYECQSLNSMEIILFEKCVSLYWKNIFGKIFLRVHLFITVMLHECHGIQNHHQLDCLFNNIIRLTTKNTSKLRITGSLWGEPQMASGCLSKGQ